MKQLLKRRLINEEDLSLFKVVNSAEAAVEEISTFYRRYHSIRFVGKLMAMRLKSPISAEQLEQIQARFGDLLSEGRFELRTALE